MISVIIPTFNEAKNIAELIPYLRSCRHGEKLDIIVSDAPISNDATFHVAEQLACKVVKTKKASRAHQMNTGAKDAKFDILYFLHADARPSKNFADQILDQAKKGKQFGIFSYKFDSPNPLLKVNSYFTKYDGLFAGGGDQSLFIMKSTFFYLGMFDENRRIMEDFDFYKRAKQAKLPFTIINDPLVVSARKYAANSWLKVNLINLRIFLLYLSNGSEERMIALNRKLTDSSN